MKIDLAMHRPAGLLLLLLGACGGTAKPPAADSTAPAPATTAAPPPALPVIDTSALGVPAYPGASLVGGQITPVTANAVVHVSAHFTAADGVQQVIAFYREHCGAGLRVSAVSSADRGAVTCVGAAERSLITVVVERTDAGSKFGIAVRRPETAAKPT